MHASSRFPMRTMLFFVAAVSHVGCQDYLFEQKCRETIKEAEIKQPAVNPTPADILFVVDNSGSMADEQENLATNFDAFIRNIAGSGDYRIAVVTTDLDSAGGKERTGLITSVFKPQNPPAEIEGFLDDPTTPCASVDIDHGCFRGPVAAERLVTSEMSPEKQKEAFSTNVLVGSCGSGLEKGLGGMLAAIEKRTTCNANFLRDSANLVVIIVSDEEDSSELTITQYADRLAAAKPGGYAQIRVAAIVGSVDGVASSCRTGAGNAPTSQCGSLCDECSGASRPAWCNSVDPTYYANFCDWCSYYNVADCCSARPGSRYVAFALEAERRIHAADPAIAVSGCRAAVGEAAGCLIDSICQTSFADTLARIAKELVVSTSFTLDPPAVFPEGVRVKLKNGRFPAEGKELAYTTDFTISPDGRVLRLLGENTPREGEDIDIQFVVQREEGSGAPRGACQ